MTKEKNIKVPELQSLDDRIAQLEKKQSLSLQAPAKAPQALAQKKTAVKKQKMSLIDKAFEDE